MILRQTFSKPVAGYWDGGKKQVFDWAIGITQKDKDGEFVKIHGFDANHWFCVAKGKTEKITLANAKKHLRAITKDVCTFDYFEEYQP